MITIWCNGEALPPTLTVEQAAELAGCGRSAAYDAVRRGRWPAVRITERRVVVCTVPFAEMLGLQLSPCRTEAAADPQTVPLMSESPKREGGAPAKRHRPQNSIATKPSDANQNVPSHERSPYE